MLIFLQLQDQINLNPSVMFIPRQENRSLQGAQPVKQWPLVARSGTAAGATLDQNPPTFVQSHCDTSFEPSREKVFGNIWVRLTHRARMTQFFGW